MMTIRRVARFAVLTVVAALMACGSDATDAQIQAIVNSVVLDLGLGKLTVGQTLKAQAILHDVAGSAVTGVPVSWTSSNSGVATVASDGTITAVSPGQSQIGASAGGHSANATLTVVAEGAPGTPVAATQLVIVRQPSSVMNGVTITPSPIVELHDANNNIVAGADQLVTASIASGNGTISGNTAMSANGIATFSDLRITGTGAFTITFSAVGLSSATSTSFNVTDVLASQLSIATQPSSSATNGQALGRQPAVQLLDASGNNVARSGVVISAVTVDTDVTLSGTTTATTDAGGTATFSDLSITGKKGPKKLRFTAPGTTPVTSDPVTVTSGPAAALSITTQPSSAAQSGVAFAQQPALQLQDVSGNDVAQSGVTVTASISTGAGSLGGTSTATTDANGIATFTNLKITGTGTHTLQFAASGLTSATSASIAVSATAPSQLSITTQPSASAQSGAAFAQQPMIQLLDATSNPVSQAGVVVTANILTGGGTLGGTTTATTNASGVAAFTNLSISGTPGARTLTFSATGFANVTSASVNVTAGSATKLTIVTQPSSTAQVGVVLAQQPSVQLRDAANNNVAQSGVTVTASVSAGTLSGTTTATTNASGVATFTNLALLGVPGSPTLTFSASGLTSATSSSIALAVGVANQLVITTQPSTSATSGVVFAAQPVVRLRDLSGNNVSQSGVNVTVAVASGTGTLNGTATVATSATGVATFAGLSITGSGAHTLKFTASGVTQATSGTITVAAAATQLAMSTQPPASVNSGATFTTAVRLKDAGGNNISTSGVSVTVSKASGSGTLGGTLTATTNTSGVATFSTLTISGSGAHTLSFASGSLTAATSNSITVNTPPPATNLGITTQPSSSATSGQAFARQPVIQLRDASNAAVSQSGVIVTASIASGGGTLGGTATATTNTSGVATFTNLSITGTDGDRTLSFAATGLTSATSSAVTVSAGPPSSEPVFDAAVYTMAYQDNMDSYTSVDAMGQAGLTGPRISPNPSPLTTSSPVQTTENALITGRNGTGKALRLQFSGGNQTSATFLTWNMPSTPTLATHYFQYWARVNFQTMPFNGVLAVKWFEAWHVHTDRVQWNTHDHLPCQLADHHPTYWQVYDQSRETTCQANQPVGPYFNEVADNQWHRFTYEYRPNSAAGARDGVARMWIDGVKVIDVSAAAIGVVPPGGEWAWCNADDVDKLAVNDGMFNQFWGSTQTTTTPAWTYDVDDYKWWYKP